MALIESFQVQMDSQPSDFSLKGVDQQMYSLQSFDKASLLVIVFMCNHCPYVKACIDRLVQLQHDFADKGVQLVGINSNDATDYPEDGFEAMKLFAQEHEMNFPYLIDETQEVARSYHAVCTPDIFVYDKSQDLKGMLRLRDPQGMCLHPLAGLWLSYHGRIDNNWKDISKVTSHDLRDALEKMVAGQKPDAVQHPSMGCSIKWKQ